jgi:hypothetical protein
VSTTVGDGLGYDVRSFDEADGSELFVEVKTTGQGKVRPVLPVGDRGPVLGGDGVSVFPVPAVRVHAGAAGVHLCPAGPALGAETVAKAIGVTP